jgi:hypothetical protein
MRSRIIPAFALFLATLVSCKGQDDCQKLLGRSPGEEHTRADKELTRTWLRECRETIDQVRSKPVVACVLAASSDEEAANCYRAEADKDTNAARKAEAAAQEAAKLCAEHPDSEQCDPAKRGLRTSDACKDNPLAKGCM